MRHWAHHNIRWTSFQRGAASSAIRRGRDTSSCASGRPFPLAAVALAAGSWCGLQEEAAAGAILAAVLLAGLALAGARRRLAPMRRHRLGLSLGLAATALLWAASARRGGRNAVVDLVSRERGGELRIEGRMRYLWDREAWCVEVVRVQAERGWERVRSQARLRVVDRFRRPDGWAVCEWAGSWVELSGRVQPHPRASNPGESEPGAAWRARGVYGILDMSHHPPPVLLQRPPQAAVWLARLREAARCALAAAVARHAAGRQEAAALWLALLLGGRGRLPSEERQPFESTGTLHLFAVSGLHVGLVAGITVRLARLTRGIGPQGAALAGALVAGAYTAVTGAPPSASRAFCMYTLWMGARPLRRAPDARAAAAWTVALLAALRPEQLLDPGLQLSFSVVVGILIWAPSLLRAAPLWGAPDPWKPRGLWGRADRWRSQAVLGVRGLAVTSAAAFAAALPWSGILFGRLAPVALLLNMLVIPLAGCALAVGLLAHLLDLASCGLVSSPFRLLWHLLDGLRGAVSIGESIPFGGMRVPVRGWDPWSGLAVALCWGIGPVALRRRGSAWRVWAGSVGGAMGLLALAPASSPPTVTVFDALGGPCLAVRDADGALLLVDAGSRAFGRSALNGYLRRWPVRAGAITAVATANRLDHVGGFLEVSPWLDGGRLVVLARVGGRSQALRSLRAGVRWREERAGKEGEAREAGRSLSIQSDGGDGWLVVLPGWRVWLAPRVPAGAPPGGWESPARQLLVVVPVSAGAPPSSVPAPPATGAACVLRVDRFAGRAAAGQLEWLLARRGWRVYRTDRDGAIVIDAAGRLAGWQGRAGGRRHVRAGEGVSDR